jgi:hypothetical protein
LVLSGLFPISDINSGDPGLSISTFPLVGRTLGYVGVGSVVELIVESTSPKSTPSGPFGRSTAAIMFWNTLGSRESGCVISL